MSKGSKLRPRSQTVTSTDFASNWDKAFKKKKPETTVKPEEEHQPQPITVQVDATTK